MKLVSTKNEEYMTKYKSIREEEKIIKRIMIEDEKLRKFCRNARENRKSQGKQNKYGSCHGFSHYNKNSKMLKSTRTRNYIDPDNEQSYCNVTIHNNIFSKCVKKKDTGSLINFYKDKNSKESSKIKFKANGNVNRSYLTNRPQSTNEIKKGGRILYRNRKSSRVTQVSSRIETAKSIKMIYENIERCQRQIHCTSTTGKISQHSSLSLKDRSNRESREELWKKPKTQIKIDLPSKSTLKAQKRKIEELNLMLL